MAELGKPMKVWALFSVVAVILSGCASAPPADVASVMASPVRARLSPNEALKIAAAAAEKEGVKMTNYQGKPQLTFDRGKIEWIVFFERVNVEYVAVGDHFMIYVDDATGLTRFVGGA